MAATRTLVVSDLDGTLLRSDAQLGTRTAAAVNELVSGGGLFTYATARSYTSAAKVTAGLDLRLPVITYSGAITVDPGTGRFDQAHLMPASVVSAILAYDDPQIQPIVFVQQSDRDRFCWIADNPNEVVTNFVAKRLGDPRLLPLMSWDQLDRASSFYLTIIGDHERVDRMAAALAPELTACHVVLSEEIYTPGEFWLELTAKQATKAVAVESLRDAIGADEVVCFGDNYNDVPLFAVADHAVAVGNAPAAVREAASEVIGTNDTESVADWIRRWTQRST